MEIIEVKQQQWPEDYFRIELKLSNICNYKCWYCFPGSNEGTYKWPDYDLLISNLEHLLNHYGNKTYQFALIGGELSHWPKFINFIEHFKKRYRCVFTITTNGSKKLEWWKTAALYLDLISVSHHSEYSDVTHNRDLLDMLYEQDVMCNMNVLMDPTAWNRCISYIEYYKQSKHTWSITPYYVQSNIPYTNEQQKIFNNGIVRNSNADWFLKNNKTYKTKVQVIDSNNIIHNFNNSELIYRKLNNFKGWECMLGVHWLAINFDGTISGTCGNNLYNDDKSYNIYNTNFVNEFHPAITPTTCNQLMCGCEFETNMFKRKLSSAEKVIPIYAN